MRKLSELFALIQRRPSRLIIATLRSCLALTLVAILLFIDVFENLSAENLALTSMFLSVIILGPGRSTGDFLRNLSLSCLALISLALPGFTILAVLGRSPVAQGFIFALIVYLAALVRARGRIFVPFYLTSVLYSFQGIYSSVLEEGSFTTSWLLGTLESWMWGFVIAIVVNSLVWPQSSESELLELIERSLEHVKVLSHLVCKTYEVAILEDEKEVRDFLIKTIREDYTQLTERASEASFEIRYSKFSMNDFHTIIDHVQALQQALITVSSTLEIIKSLDPKGINLKRHLLAKAEATENFRSFRKGIEIIILEITNALLDRKNVPIESVTTSEKASAKGEDLEVEAGGAVLLRAVTTASVAKLGARLRNEVDRSPIHATFDSTSTMIFQGGRRNSVNTFKTAFERFQEAQTEAIIELIKSESLNLEDVLQIEVGAPSLQSIYSDKLPKAWTSSLVSSTPLSRVRVKDKSKPTLLADETTTQVDEDTPCSESLTKTFSLLFGLKQLTDELSLLHLIVSKTRVKRLHIRILERFWKEGKKVPTMTLQQALSGLRGEEHVTPSVSLIRRFLAFEKSLRSTSSLYAMKVSLGATVYTALLLSPTLQPFFIEYGISSSLITIIVAISPVLGETFWLFILQLSGTGFGTLYGLLLLEIFQHGESYSPYGLTCGLSLVAIFSSYIFYLNSKYYSFGLLSMVGAGTIVGNEWLHRNDSPAYASPALRAGYTLTAMSISIAIAAFFQVVLFRHSARRQLRLDIASITFGLSSYNTLLQSYINAVSPADLTAIENQPTYEAIKKLNHELKSREAILQKSIIALSVTFEFAKVEPKVFPFQEDVLLRIINSHQIILDRLREARSSLGSQGFNVLVHHEFVSKLYPYRIASQRLARTLFYLSATSLISKTPLPRDVPSSKSTWISFEHDALVLSRRLSRLPNGEEELRKPGFLRYFFYLTSIRAVSAALEDLETYLGELFGVPEEIYRLLS